MTDLAFAPGRSTAQSAYLSFVILSSVIFAVMPPAKGGSEQLVAAKHPKKMTITPET
jgi:hypothetical protein